MWRRHGRDGRVTSGNGDFACKLAVGVGGRPVALVFEDAAASLGRFFVGHVLGDLGLEDRHLVSQAVTDGGHDPLRV